MCGGMRGSSWVALGSLPARTCVEGCSPPSFFIIHILLLSSLSGNLSLKASDRRSRCARPVTRSFLPLCKASHSYYLVREAFRLVLIKLAVRRRQAGSLTVMTSRASRGRKQAKKGVQLTLMVVGECGCRRNPRLARRALCTVIRRYRYDGLVTKMSYRACKPNCP